MTDLLAARLQMALSLGFHIVFASIGMAMPFLMATAHACYLRRGEESFKILTQAWSKGVAIFFAVGAVSGTALAFELGLLWPGFMKYAGPIIGMPFSWEGTAFFLEAIALGVFLYGWDRVPARQHWVSGLVVGLAGVASAYFVICANAWMNHPSGFAWNDGNPIHIDPWKAMFNARAPALGIHMIIASFQAVGFAVAGVHALLYRRHALLIHRQGIRIALYFAIPASLLQPIVGHWAAENVAAHQPEKLAAMEAHFETRKEAPLIIGGIPKPDEKRVDYAIQIPGLLSWLAFGDSKATVKGLDQFPRENWPPVVITHLSFQVMVGLGSLLALLSVLSAFHLRSDKFPSPWFLKSLVAAIPLGFLAIEAGWVVTETGRQPWIIYRLLRTADSLTPRANIEVTLGLYAVIYFFLAAIAVTLLIRQTRLLHKKLRLGS